MLYRALLVAPLLVSVPVAAQSAADTAAIRAAIAGTAPDWWSPEGVNSQRVAALRIVADTAWARVYDPRTDLVHLHPREPGVAWGTAARTREMRLERRHGRWIRVAVKTGPIR